MSTSIAWTNETWNVVVGCSHVSAGCEHCYAERMDKRIRGFAKQEFKPWGAQNAAYNVRLHPERLDAPLHWKTPRRVFVNSMSDLFHEQVPDEFVKQVFGVMNDERARKHTFQILTKRPERMQEFIYSKAINGLRLAEFPLANVWLGVSCEDQKTADERIPLLLQTPAAVRFLSCEPLLGPIRFRESWLDGQCDHPCENYFEFGECACTRKNGPNTKISWVICGGESGPNFRPMDLNWARSIRDQCIGANVPFFYKQGSAYRPQQDATLDGVEWHQFPEVKP